MLTASRIEYHEWTPPAIYIQRLQENVNALKYLMSLYSTRMDTDRSGTVNVFETNPNLAHAMEYHQLFDNALSPSLESIHHLKNFSSQKFQKFTWHCILFLVSYHKTTSFPLS